MIRSGSPGVQQRLRATSDGATASRWVPRHFESFGIAEGMTVSAGIAVGRSGPSQLVSNAWSPPVSVW